MNMFNDSDNDIDNNIIGDFTNKVDKLMGNIKPNSKGVIGKLSIINVIPCITDKDIEHLICLNIFDEIDDTGEYLDYTEIDINEDEISLIIDIIKDIQLINCQGTCCDGCINCNIVYQENIANKISNIFEKRREYHSSTVQLRERVIGLMNMEQPEQRSQEWYELRNGMITTSDWGSVFSDKKYKNPYSSRKELVLKKCGISKPFTGNIYTEWGIKYEAVANSIYEKKYDTTIIEFGLIQHSMYDYLGASPDGISMDGIMLEIKCPPKRAISDKVPGYYWVQVQGQLETCNLERCDFLQCKLVEYELFEYLQDENPYRGCVIDYMNTNTNKLEYFYSEFCLDSNQINEWDESLEIGDHLINKNKSFWYLQQITCIPIYRDREWFAQALPELTQFWNEVLGHRSDDSNTLINDHNNAVKLRLDKKKKASTPDIILNYAFSDSE
jgi:putative phage-type endonuclease